MEHRADNGIRTRDPERCQASFVLYQTELCPRTSIAPAPRYAHESIFRPVRAREDSRASPAVDALATNSFWLLNFSGVICRNRTGTLGATSRCAATTPRPPLCLPSDSNRALRCFIPAPSPDWLKRRRATARRSRGACRRSDRLLRFHDDLLWVLVGAAGIADVPPAAVWRLLRSIAKPFASNARAKQLVRSFAPRDLAERVGCEPATFALRVRYSAD